MKRTDLQGLELDAEVIDKIMAFHGQTVNKHLTSIAALTTERDELKTDADKYQTTSKTLEEVQGKLDAYVVDEQNREFQTKLTGFDIKADRVAPFMTLLGDDRSDEAINKLKESYPEWVTSKEPATPPADDKKPQFAPPGNPTPPPSGGQDDWAQAMADAWK